MFHVTADSNIYISALQFGGKPLRLLTLAAEGEIHLATSDPIIEEVVRTLLVKFDWPPERVEKARQIIIKIARKSRRFANFSEIFNGPGAGRIDPRCARDRGGMREACENTCLIQAPASGLLPCPLRRSRCA